MAEKEMRRADHGGQIQKTPSDGWGRGDSPDARRETRDESEEMVPLELCGELRETSSTCRR